VARPLAIHLLCIKAGGLSFNGHGFFIGVSPLNDD
jgi:hypothetical protein